MSILDENGLITLWSNVVGRIEAKEAFNITGTVGNLLGDHWAQGNNGSTTAADSICNTTVVKMLANHSYTVTTGTSDYCVSCLSICTNTGTHQSYVWANSGSTSFTYTPTENCYARVAFTKSDLSAIDISHSSNFDWRLTAGKWTDLWTYRKTGNWLELWRKEWVTASSGINEVANIEFPFPFVNKEWMFFGGAQNYKVNTSYTIDSNKSENDCSLAVNASASLDTYIYMNYVGYANPVGFKYDAKNADTPYAKVNIDTQGNMTLQGKAYTSTSAFIAPLFDKECGPVFEAGTYELFLTCDDSSAESVAANQFKIQLSIHTSYANRNDQSLALATVGVNDCELALDWASNYGVNIKKFTIEKRTVLYPAILIPYNTEGYGPYQFKFGIRRIK